MKTIDLTKYPRLGAYLGDSKDDSPFCDDIDALTQALPTLVKVMDDCDDRERNAYSDALVAIALTIDNMREVLTEISPSIIKPLKS